MGKHRGMFWTGPRATGINIVLTTGAWTQPLMLRVGCCVEPMSERVLPPTITRRSKCAVMHLGAEFEGANRRWESVCLRRLCWHFVAHPSDQVIDNSHDDHCLSARGPDGEVGSATKSRAVPS